MLSDVFPPGTTKGDSETALPSDDRKWSRRLRLACASVVGATATYLGACVAALLLYSVIFPPITGVQLQHSVESALSGSDPRHVYVPIPLSQIDRSLPWATIAGEDGRFFWHYGIDWHAINQAVNEYQEGKPIRGGSSITQQLVKNLFMTTHRTFLRKALEVPLTYAAELLLSKRRILELYVNVIEWGPGVYGVEAASWYYYGISAADLTRAQSAALAACIPNPRARHPARMGRYQGIILRRMKQLDQRSLPSYAAELRPPPTPASPDAQETDTPAEASVADSAVDSAVVDSPSPPDSLLPTDTVPAADGPPPPDSLPSADSVVGATRGAGLNDTIRTDSVRSRPPDTVRRNTEPAPDSTGTP